MSLTSFINRSDVRAKLKEVIAQQQAPVNIPLRVLPVSANPSLVGTAFDYLLRFYIQRQNKVASQGWVATAGLWKLGQFLGSRRSRLYKLAENSHARALEAHADYLRNGRVNSNLLRSTIHLARLDMGVRPGPEYLLTEHLTDPCDDEVRELRELYSIIPRGMFIAEHTCVLNPSFGDASILVGGADTDLIIDDTLIDFKVVRDFNQFSRHICQLVGYYILLLLSGEANGENINNLSRLGLYFARHGHLHLVSVDDLIERAMLPDLVRWFFEAAAHPLDRPGYLQEFAYPYCREWWLEITGKSEQKWERIQKDKQEWDMEDRLCHPCNRARIRREKIRELEDRRLLYRHLRGLIAISGSVPAAAARIKVLPSEIRYYLRSYPGSPLSKSRLAHIRQLELEIAFKKLPKRLRARCLTGGATTTS